MGVEIREKTTTHDWNSTMNLNMVHKFDTKYIRYTILSLIISAPQHAHLIFDNILQVP